MTHHDQAGVLLDGKYRLDAQMAEGGMGVLYRAMDLASGTPVAVKVLRSEQAGRADARARFALEGRAVRALRHPHIVQVLGSGEDAQGRQYLVMELLQGVGLQEALVLRRTLGVEEALTLLLPIAGALSWAHDLGVLHRDVKPANIFLAKTAQGVTLPKLLDFGMARLDGQPRVTRSGQIVGTVGYMSPEQAGGREVGAQADVWSLGAVFFRCLSGVDPFDGPNEANVLLQVALGRSRPLRSIESSVPDSVARVVERALERDPVRRFGDVQSFVHALVQAAADARLALPEDVDGIGLPDYPRWRSEAIQRASSLPLHDDVAATQVSYARAPDSRDFVGRIDVLEHLSDGVQRAIEKRGGVALVLGEPGMGKTRLLHELGTRARELGASVLFGLCEEGEAAPPYWPWVQLLRQLSEHDTLPSAQAHEALPADVRVVLEASALESGQAPARHSQQERLRFFDATASFLERCAKSQPLVLLIDDAHWADSASLALLSFLARRSPRHAIYIVATCRAEGSADTGLRDALAALSDCAHHRLTALSEHETRELCLRTAGTLLSEPRLRDVADRSGGNPLFIKELSRLYAEHGDGTDTKALPAAIKDSIQRRLSQRTKECVSTLECAAVLGGSFDLGSLVYVTDLPAGEVLDLLDEARKAHLVREAAGARSRYRFTNAVVQEVLYERLRTSKRVQIHRAAAEHLLRARGDDPEALSLIAHHAVRGASAGGAERAVELAVHAGQKAAKQLAFEKALDWFGEALETLELCQGPDLSERRARILIAAGSAHYRSGASELARKACASAAAIAEKAGLAELFAEAALGFAREGALHPTLDLPAVQLLERALVLLPDTDSAPRARVLARMAVLLYGGSCPDRVEALARESARIAEAIGDGRTQVAAFIALSLVLGESARVQDRLDLTERIITVARKSSDAELEAHARVHRVCDLLRLGDLRGCESELDQIEATGQRTSNPLFRWNARQARATLCMARGELEAAERMAIEARELARTFMPATARASFGAQTYPIYRLQGRLDELALIMEHDLVVLPEVGRRGYAAGLMVDAGNVEGAREQLRWLSADDFARAPRDWFRMPYWARVVELASFLQDRDAATAAYAALLPHAGQLFAIGSTASEGAIDRLLGMASAVLGDTEQTLAHFERGLDINTRLGAVPWLTRTQRELARFLRTSEREADQRRADELEAAVLSTVRARNLHGLGVR